LKAIDPKYITGHHVKSLDGYIKLKGKFSPDRLEDKGIAF
jgi:hypothetical protein